MKKLLTLSLAIFAFAACNQQAPAPEAKPEVAPKAEVQQPVAQQEQQEQVAISLPALKGGNLDFTAQISTKPTVVAVMAGFCGFCKKMLPLYDEVAGKVDSKKVDVIVAFVDDTADTIKDLEPVKAVKNAKIYYNGGAVAQQNRVTGFPTMLLFKDGKVVDTWRGFSPDHVQAIIDATKNL